jgi:DNA helicase-2/ATP-dependent DNA helicase PcrA
MKQYSLHPITLKNPGLEVYERDLNPQQLEVVTAGSGPALVIAGAGSGKTRAVTYRVAYLIESGVPAQNIMLATFTNKAAREMLQRAELLVNVEIRKIYGGTFHHIANVILRRHAALIGYGENYTILDKEDSKDLLDSIVRELRIDTKDKRFPKGDVLSNMFSLAASTRRNVPDVLAARYPFFFLFADAILRIERQYAEKKKKMNCMDYDDLLLNLLVLLQNEEIRQVYTERFLHVLVDEYQDTNKIQADLVDLFASRHRNIMAVGDDSQSIYSFRGANFENILNFPDRYPDVRIIKLEINYRSTPELLRLANESILHNPRQYQKKLQPVKRDGAKPNLVPLADGNQQACFAAQRILELREEGYSLSDMAVLYRSHYHSMELQMELTRRGIPYEIRSGIRFFEQRHIKDVVAHLKICLNPFDELAWTRVMKLLPKVGNVSAHKVWLEISTLPDPLSNLRSDTVKGAVPKGARQAWETLAGLIEAISKPPIADAPSEMIRRVLDGGYRDYLNAEFPNADSRAEDLEQLSTFCEKFDSLEQALSELSLLTNLAADTVTVGVEEDERLVLTTVHQAKGLEWPIVFIIDLAEGRFPSSQSLRETYGEEEERRLFYVAVTRAKDELFLCYPLIGSGGGREDRFFRPSRFLTEIGEDVFEKWVVEGSGTLAIYPYDPER